MEYAIYLMVAAGFLNHHMGKERPSFMGKYGYFVVAFVASLVWPKTLTVMIIRKLK